VTPRIGNMKRKRLFVTALIVLLPIAAERPNVYSSVTLKYSLAPKERNVPSTPNISLLGASLLCFRFWFCKHLVPPGPKERA